MKRTIGMTLASLVFVGASVASARADESMAKLDEKVGSAKEVYQELLQTPDKAVPQALLDQCKCVAVIPHALKGAIGYGARMGMGVISCRNGDAWSPPSFLKLTGGSVGLQIGAQSSDIVLFFMNERGARSLINSKFTLGGTASVAAGPAGRSAEASTDIKLNAEIYSYAKSKGLFAGISLEGARLAPDKKANATYYGAPVTTEALLFGKGAPRVPDSAKGFLEALPGTAGPSHAGP